MGPWGKVQGRFKKQALTEPCGFGRREVHAIAHTHSSKSDGKLHRNFLHPGNGGKFKEGSKSKHSQRSVDVVEERYMPQHTHKKV